MARATTAALLCRADPPGSSSVALRLTNGVKRVAINGREESLRGAE